MSAKASPLLGYNNNVRHRGRVFHIQTEDSGVRYGHVITHLFMDGGRILKSVKTSYAEHVESEHRAEIVREMMKRQHKAMFLALREGIFDPIVEGSVQPSQETRAVAAEAPPKTPAERAPSRAAPSRSSPVGDRASGEELTRSPPSAPQAAQASAAPLACDLPPPPANLLREKTAAAGMYRVTASSTADARGIASEVTGIAGRIAPRAAPAVANGSRPAPSPAVNRRGPPVRPASSFGQAPPQQGKTIFGEDPMNDKSLDEVILSYLSAEPDGAKKK